MSEPAESVNDVALRRSLSYLVMIAILLILVCISLGPMTIGPVKAPFSVSLQQTRNIGLVLFAYCNDHDLKYPDGKSSTEVFQKLIDEKYVSDPTVFYIPLSGKIKPFPGQKLKPENVSFDMTSGIDSSSPDQLPVVFMTGYRVIYVRGGAAVPVINPFPRFGFEDPIRPWYDLLLGRHTIRYSDTGGMAVIYKSNSAKFIKPVDSGSAGGVIPNFISPDFKPDGKTYRQLTPDGMLPDN